MGSRVVGSWMSSARAGRGSVRAWIGLRLTAVLASIAIAFVGVAWAAPVGAATGAVAASPATNGVPYLVKDIRASGGSKPSDLTNVAGTLFFVADDGSHGRELWKSDGSSGGTRIVKDIRAGRAGSHPHSLVAVGGLLYFVATDGAHGGELWKSDGTSAGTRLVKDIRPGSRSSAPASLTAVGANLYFVANDGTHGNELWVSDGTRAGTHLVKDIVAGRGSSTPTLLTASAGRLFFAVGSALWRSNGTRAGTRQVHDFAYSPEPVAIDALIAMDRTVFAIIQGRLDHGLWATDGTASGGQPLVGFQDPSPWSLATLGGFLYFKAYLNSDPNTLYLFRSDGTQAGTEIITPHLMAANGLVALIGSLFWTDSHASSTDEQNRLWISDGSAAGTQVVFDGGSTWRIYFHDAAVVGETIFFAAGPGYQDADGWHDNVEPWQTDGTSAGTQPIGDLNPNGSSFPSEFTKVGASLYFVADDGSHGQELWRFVP